MKQDAIMLPSSYDPSTRDGDCLSRRVFLKGIGLACLGFVPLLQGCDNAFSREGTGAGTARPGSAPRVARPPIDVSAPAGTRTATFSLG